MMMDTDLELRSTCYNGTTIASPRLSRDTDLRQSRRHMQVVLDYLRITGQRRLAPAKEG